MKVPFLSLSSSINEMRPAIDAAHARVLDRGWVLMGPELEGFEKEWATWLGVRHAVGVANGLDAIRLILEAVGVRAGDEVIVPSNTYIATWLAVSELGARPVPVEPDERTCNIDPARIEAAITEKTRAILVVHLYGQSADMDPILDLARRRGLPVIEDAAQAHGARYHGRKVAAHGHAVAWSFYPTKNLGALADAGAITTDDDALADRLRVLRNYGQRKRYVCEVQGWNSRMDEMSAAVLREKLIHLEDWNARRSTLAERYQRELSDLGLQLPWVAHGNDPVWHLYVVRHQLRDKIQAELEQLGVGTICHYPIPPHLQEAYADLRILEGSMPIAERIHRTCFSLPLHPHLSDEQQHYVIVSLRRVMGA